MTVAEMRAKRAKLITDAQVILRNEQRTSEQFAQANAMLDDADAVKTQYEAIERADAMELETRSIQNPNLPAPGGSAEETPEVRQAKQAKAFRSFLANGEAKLTAEDRKYMIAAETRDMGVAAGASGAYIVPTGFNPNIENAKKAYGKLLTVVNNWITDSGAPIQWPMSDDVAQYSQEMTDGTDVTESDIPLSQATFNVSTFTTGLIKVSRSLLTDSAFDLGKFIEENFGVRMARGLNKAVTLGSTSGNVASIIAASTLGATSAAPTAASYQDLVNVYGALDPAYIETSTFAFNNTFFRGLIALLDGYGRPLFMPSMTSGIPELILGRPYVLNQDMANPVATAVPLLFGDLSKYKLRSVAGLEVLRLNERYAPANQVGFVGFHRNSGKLLDAGTHPVVNLTMHA